MKVNLVNGLSKIIAEVEKLPQATVFEMEDYRKCVIGKTVGWSNGWYSGIRNARTLRRIFGIKKEAESNLFSSDASSKYTERTWSVISLFTSFIADEIGRDAWLELAKQVETSLQSA